LLSLIFSFLILVGSILIPIFGSDILFRTLDELNVEKAKVIKIKTAYKIAEQRLIKKTIGL